MVNEPPARVIERLHAASFIVDGTGCIETTYSLGSHGYGQIGWNENGKTVTQTAHRVAWFAANGDIPLGMTIDHICRNRPCVNVDHLRLLTNAENAGDTAFTRRTHCPRGHEYDEENTYRTPSKRDRRCRACARLLGAMRRQAA